MATGGLFVITAPSGAGKTSLVQTLLREDPHCALSISYTTRPPRPGEAHGVDYFFVDTMTFEHMVKEGAFLEWAKVYDHYYGTAKKELWRLQEEGKDVILEIDWQGARAVRAVFPKACLIFIVPPSLQILQERLIARGKDSSEAIEKRMSNAREELSHCVEFDYIVINDHFEEAKTNLLTIIKAQRLSADRQIKRHAGLFSTWLKPQN
jgi:guanylate kinase